MRPRSKCKRVFESDLLENRAGDNWQPLMAIANAAGDDWVIEAAKAAQQMSKKDVQDSKSIGRYLLESLDKIITERRKEKREAAQGELGMPAQEARLFLPTSDLLEKLNKDEEAPWRESEEGRKAELSPHRLAALLKKYDLRSDEPQIAGERARGY